MKSMIGSIYRQKKGVKSSIYLFVFARSRGLKFQVLQVRFTIRWNFLWHRIDIAHVSYHFFQLRSHVSISLEIRFVP
jgi:hypothetical protein